jgi:hypothetical protein
MLYNKKRDIQLEQIMKSDKLSKDEAKEVMLASVNSEAQQRKVQNPFVIEFDNEMKEIQQELRKINEYAVMLKDANTDKNNQTGSFINLVLCKYENEVLQTVISLLKVEGIEICTLMFDGLMVYGDYYADEDLLTRLEAKILKVNKISLKLHYKQHSTDIKVPDDFVCSALTDYGSTKKTFEENHIKVGEFYLQEKEEGVKIMSRKQLNDTYEHMNCYNEDAKKVGFIKEWMKDETIRRKDRTDIYPIASLCPPNVYNLWMPFRCETFTTPLIKQEQALQKYLHHVNMLCNYSENVTKFVHLFIAHMIQYPQNKSIMLCLIGNEGGGKSFIILALTKMLGSKKVVMNSNPGRDVWGNFNTLMKDAFLVNLNEISIKDFKDAEGRVKQLITDPTFTYRDLHQSPITLTSYHRFIVTTNNEESIPSKKGDRRNALIRCNDEKIVKDEHDTENAAYHTELYAMLEDDNAVRTIYDYYKNYPDVPTHITKKDIPITDFQKDIQNLNKEPIELFFENIARENSQETSLIKTNSKLWYDFQQYCEVNGYRYGQSSQNMNSNQFASRIGRIQVDGIGKSEIKWIDGKNQRCRTLDLIKMRKKFGIEEEVEEESEEEVSDYEGASCDETSD